MSALDLIRYATAAAFLAIAIVTAVRAVRRPVRANVDVALLFAAVAYSLTQGVVLGLLGITPTPRPLAALTGALILALPLLTLRAMRGVVQVPRSVVIAAAITWAASSVAIALIEPPVPPVVTIPVVIGFVFFEGYAGVATLRAARRSRGVSRRRLQLVAIGTGLFALALAVAGAGIVVPLVALAALPLALLSGVAYLVGLAPPALLRRAWEAPEAYGFIQTATRLAGEPDEEVLLRSLSQSIATAMGTSSAGVGLWDREREVLVYWPARGDRLERRLDESLTAPAFLEQRALIIDEATTGDRRVPDAFRTRARHIVLAAPMTIGPHRIGLVSTIAEHTTFLEDDLELLRLLADQAAVVIEHRRLYERVGSLNRDLERRLAELRVVNDELASFAYSVSHDLRAPLRSIDGFSQIILEDHAAVLGDEGRRHLERVRAATSRMSALIDDLLNLSRVTRDDMRPETVDLAPIAAAIVDELRAREPARQVEYECAVAARAAADPRMMRIVLANLFENAWKFTRGRAPARITFSGEVRDGLSAFCVRDNGVGFDMRYADKLFGAFQRLHSQQEFEGTGVGLATVQRIVHRHGGSVWAEGEPANGASFWFTLPSADGRSAPADGVAVG